MDHTYAIIMAGGGGTRLWPLSRRDRPKQAIRLLGDRTLFQLAVDRLKGLLPLAHVFVVTVARQAALLQSQAPEVPAANYLLEPAPRGTASVIGWAAVVLRHRDPEAVMACLTADHYIRNVKAFQRLLRAAFQVAAEGELVTLGISPTHPATGYGYIHRGQRITRIGDLDVYRVLAFREKPDRGTAEAYLRQGTFSWNSGMFVWRADRILDEIARWMPDLHQALREIEAALGTPQEREVLERLWQGLQPETIDYGVMEHADQVAVIPADDLGWWDIGGWDRLFEVLEPDAAGNLVLAPETLVLDSSNSLLFQGAEGKHRLIALLGVQGLVVVDTGDALLVCSRERAEEVRKVVEELARQGREEYL